LLRRRLGPLSVWPSSQQNVEGNAIISGNLAPVALLESFVFAVNMHWFFVGSVRYRACKSVRLCNIKYS
jgi:hypothetical protein